MFFWGCQQPALGHLLKLVWRGSDSLQRAFHSISEVTWNVFWGWQQPALGHLLKLVWRGLECRSRYYVPAWPNHCNLKTSYLALAAATAAWLRLLYAVWSLMNFTSVPWSVMTPVATSECLWISRLSWNSRFLHDNPFATDLGFHVYIYMMYNLISQSTKHEFH